MLNLHLLTFKSMEKLSKYQYGRTHGIDEARILRGLDDSTVKVKAKLGTYIIVVCNIVAHLSLIDP